MCLPFTGTKNCLLKLGSMNWRDMILSYALVQQHPRQTSQRPSVPKWFWLMNVRWQQSPKLWYHWSAITPRRYVNQEYYLKGYWKRPLTPSPSFLHLWFHCKCMIEKTFSKYEENWKCIWTWQHSAITKQVR